MKHAFNLSPILWDSASTFLWGERCWTCFTTSRARGRQTYCWPDHWGVFADDGACRNACLKGDGTCGLMCLVSCVSWCFMYIVSCIRISGIFLQLRQEMSWQTKTEIKEAQQTVAQHCGVPGKNGQALRVLVPFVGMLFVIHLAEHDRHRFIEEGCLDWEMVHTNSSSGGWSVNC